MNRIVRGRQAKQAVAPGLATRASRLLLPLLLALAMPRGPSFAVGAEGTGAADARQMENPDVERAFARALEFEIEKKLEDAAREFETLAADHPDSGKAAEALFRAAGIRDAALGSYRAAIDLYARLEGSYPQSRFTNRARQRVAYLERYALGDEEAFRAYEQAIQKAARGESRTDDVVEELLSVVDRHEGSPVAPMALLAAARDLRKKGDIGEADRRIRELLDRYPGADAAAEARRELGDLAFEKKRYEEALDQYARLSEMGRPGDPWRELGSRLSQRPRAHIFRRRIFVLCVALLTLFTAAALLGTPWRAIVRHGPRRVWVDLAVLATLMSPFVFLASRQGPILLQMTLRQTAATAAILVLCALRLSAPPAGRFWKCVFPVAAILAILAAQYAVLYSLDLTFLLEQLIQKL